MGVTAILGEGGVGKTSFIVARVKHLLRTEGQRRLNKSIEKIEEYNKGREVPLTPPDKVPIFFNFDAEYNLGPDEIYKPYFLDEEYFGLPNMDKLVAPVPPYSIIGFQEMDDEYNSRSRNLAKAVAGAYNKWRHWNLEIFMDLHKLLIMDSIIRSVVTLFIEIQSSEHEKNFAGRIIRTTWNCREFDDVKEIQRYISSDGKEGSYKETSYKYEGNIFKCFDSQNCAKDFLPKDGDDFVYLLQKSETDISKLPLEISRFYSKGAKLK